MFLDIGDGYRYNDQEGQQNKYRFECQLFPDTYQKLLSITHENGLVTFDVSTAINFVISNFPRKTD